MQKMLRRTVTVGRKFALHIWTAYMIGLSILSIFNLLSLDWGWDTFRTWCIVTIAYSLAGIITAVYALWHIENKRAQIREDLERIRALVFRR